MKAKRFIGFIAAAMCLLIALSACGNSSATASSSSNLTSWQTAPENAADDYFADENHGNFDSSMESADADGEYYGQSSNTGSFSGGSSMDKNGDGSKIIMQAEIELETEDFKATAEHIDALVQQFGGRTASSNVYNYHEQRSAYYEVKIPSENYKAFMKAAADAGNLLRQNESSDDVSSQYTDIEARLATLKLAESRMLLLMEESGTLEELIMLQHEIGDIQYEIERYTLSLQNYDKRIAYSTIQIFVQEVSQTTPPAPVGFSDRIASAFNKGWQGFVGSLQRFAIGFVENLITIIIWLIILAVIFILVRKNIKKRKEKKAAPAKSSLSNEDNSATQTANAKEDTAAPANNSKE